MMNPKRIIQNQSLLEQFGLVLAYLAVKDKSRSRESKNLEAAFSSWQKSAMYILPNTVPFAFLHRFEQRFGKKPKYYAFRGVGVAIVDEVVVGLFPMKIEEGRRFELARFPHDTGDAHQPFFTTKPVPGINAGVNPQRIARRFSRVTV